jgi:Uma2 family endonuclease
MPASSTTREPGGGGPKAVSEAEWSAMDEDEPGELVDGVLVVEEVPDIVHEVVVTWLSVYLGTWLLPRGGVIGGAARFLIGPGKGRKTDVFVFFAGSPKPRRRGASRRPPDIVIEVVSPTPRDVRRDRIEKMAEYATFGVKWYWIVDPEARTVEIHERATDGVYRHALGASAGTIEVPACPGLTLDLTDLWNRVDDLPDDET